MRCVRADNYFVIPARTNWRAALGWCGRWIRIAFTTSPLSAAGPAGFATAVYAASEGLSVLVLDCRAFGGQAGQVENRLHWRLDVAMNEDQQRNRSDNGPHNLAILRHMALNVIQKKPSKGSMRGKRKRASSDDAYLCSLLRLF